jgi:hypothetical protein
VREKREREVREERRETSGRGERAREGREGRRERGERGKWRERQRLGRRERRERERERGGREQRERTEREDLLAALVKRVLLIMILYYNISYYISDLLVALVKVADKVEEQQRVHDLRQHHVPGYYIILYHIMSSFYII